MRHDGLPDGRGDRPAAAVPPAAEPVEPAAVGGSAQAESVRRMFGAVAPHYDLLNHLLSLNIDRRWRRRAIDRLLQHAPADGHVLDACAGTLDLAVELAGRPSFDGQVLAVDFALPMLDRGIAKVGGLPVHVVCGDALRLPAADASLDGATVGFGVRNLGSITAGLAEFARVLRPGAPLIVLEFTTPTRQPLRALYLFYFRTLLPRIGRAVSRHEHAYDYLPASVLAFPTPPMLAQMLEQAGFRDVHWEPLTGGIVAIHRALRDETPAQSTATSS